MEVLLPVKMPITEREGDLLGDFSIGRIGDRGGLDAACTVMETAGAKGEECSS